MSDLVGNPEDRFSCITAHMSVLFSNAEDVGNISFSVCPKLLRIVKKLSVSKFSMLSLLPFANLG